MKRMKYKLGDVCTSMVRGPFGSALKKEFFVEKADYTYKVYEQGNAIRKDSNYGNYYVNQEKYLELKRFEVRPMDFIMSCSGTIGELYQIPLNAEKGIINQALLKMTIDNKIVDNEYFKYIFRHNIKKLESKGSGIQNVASIKILKDIEFEIPTLDEQYQIVKQLNLINGMINCRKEQYHKLDEIIKARFVELFGSGEYPQVSISELVAGKVQSVKKVFSTDDEIKYIDISSIDNKRNVMTGYTEYVLCEAPSRAQQHIKKGDIVVSTVRPNLRNVAMTEFEDDNLVASSGFCVLRAVKCLPEYLLAIVCSDKFTDDITKVVTGANYPAIKDSDIMNYQVSMPPMELQEEFADFVNQVDKSKFTVRL